MRELETFFKNNAWSKIDVSDTSKIDGSSSSILTPWGDDSLQILIPADPHDSAPLIDSLNKVILPKRLSALFELEARRLEVIWTALKIPPSLEEISKREFTFCFHGKEHKCYFSESSSHLLNIARRAVPIGQSNTNFRNLNSFSRYALELDGATRDRLFGKPKSFYPTFSK